MGHPGQEMVYSDIYVQFFGNFPWERGFNSQPFDGASGRISAANRFWKIRCPIAGMEEYRYLLKIRDFWKP
ncbi:MAG: hypothetical protein U5K27_14925 [Desulfotignum sp.]|nr:hypothetical protein [Desulfotignum sp.]